jgi:crossover junction endodeoxyribonuclease RuvC
MIILGVDPGTATTGFSIIKNGKGKQELLDFGVVFTDKKKRSEVRLREICEGLENLVKKWRVDEISLELVFFNTNAKTVLAVGESRGIVKLVAAKNNLPIFEYTPLQVKIALTGYGLAEKGQVGKMVQKAFGLKSVPKPDDAADAVAIGLCHCFSRKIKTL